MKEDLPTAGTTIPPRPPSLCTSLEPNGVDVVDEVRSALASLTTGEWRRAVNQRLAGLDPPLGKRQ